MSPAVAQAVASLTDMTVGELRGEYQRVFGEPTGSYHKTWLVRKIAWRMQAEAEGGLSDRAVARAKELANEADIRVTPPRAAVAPVDMARSKIRTVPLSDGQELVPGTLLQREWKGRTMVVRVLEQGFEYDGETFSSLSAVARAITGTKWNGFVFFGLKKRSGASRG
jgi:hypothetical protein